MAIAPEWEYDGQDGMSQVKDYQRTPTPDMTAIQQVRYIEVLQRVALEEGVHLRTSSSQHEIHVAPINCSPEDDAWDITYTFVKTNRITGLKADISDLGRFIKAPNGGRGPPHAPCASICPRARCFAPGAMHL